jgi:hypothetical protein
MPCLAGFAGYHTPREVELTAIIQDIVMMYTHYGPQLSALHLPQQYSRLVAWREDLPSVIDNIENNNSQALPHVLSLL